MKQPAKAIPPGKALNTPPDELDMLALISMEDIELAKADAAAKMTPRGKALVEATKAEQEQDAV